VSGRHRNDLTKGRPRTPYIFFQTVSNSIYFLKQIPPSLYEAKVMKKFLFLALICTMSTSFAQTINRGGWTHPADSTRIYLSGNDTAYVWVKCPDLVAYNFDTGYIKIDTSTTTTRPTRIRGITKGENFFNGNLYLGILITKSAGSGTTYDSLQVSYVPFDNNGVVFDNDIRYCKVADGSISTTAIWNFTASTTPTAYVTGTSYGFGTSSAATACGFRFRFISQSISGDNKIMHIAVKVWLN
jgi:hypothetical protein